MNLEMNIRVGEAFKSPAQLARVISEDWAKRNLYCPVCTNDELTQTRNNTKALDFVCPSCVARFELKSSKRWNSRRIPDAGYSAMMNAISNDRNPNLFVLHYDSNWVVRNLLLVPSFFLTPSAIEKRNPLAATARRSGWIGCNILLANVPQTGRIEIVSHGAIAEPSKVRSEYARAMPFSSLGSSVRGWTLDVLKVVETLPSTFTLNDMYLLEEHLAQLHPKNRNIRPKIRQQLQVLRDMDMIEFLGSGEYRKT